MAAGVRGRLVSAAFADTDLASLPGARRRRRPSFATSRHGSIAATRRSARRRAFVPLPTGRSFRFSKSSDMPSSGGSMNRHGSLLEALTASRAAVPVVIVPWNESLERTWRDRGARGRPADARWCFCCQRRLASHCRRPSHLVAALHRVRSRRSRPAMEPARMILWSLARAEAMSGPAIVLDRASELSARHGAAVCKALGDGVLHALELLISALSSSGRPQSARPVRPVAHGAVPGAVPPVRGGARTRPDVAPRLPRSLQHRRHRHDAAGRTAVPRNLARGAGDFAARARRLLCR